MTQTTNDTELITIVVVILAALIIVPFLLMSVGMMGFGGMMGGMWGGGMWGGGMWGDGTGWMWLIGMLVPFVFLLVLVGAGYAIYRSVSGTDGDDPALEELRLAYARGELTDEEYEQRRDALERDR